MGCHRFSFLRAFLRVLRCLERCSMSLFMRRIGLVGPPTATEVGPELAQVLQCFLDQMGPYPHASIAVRQKTKVGSRLRLFECGCEPPVKVRAARDDLRVMCLECEQEFQLVE